VVAVHDAGVADQCSVVITHDPEVTDEFFINKMTFNPLLCATTTCYRILFDFARSDPSPSPSPPSTSSGTAGKGIATLSPKGLIVSHIFCWTRGDDEFPFPILLGKGPGDG